MLPNSIKCLNLTEEVSKIVIYPLSFKTILSEKMQIIRERIRKDVKIEVNKDKKAKKNHTL
ncbi:hypothetical protein C9J41_01820 [Photobacterium sp. GB-50]|nr:hypothetical protein C9J41_01820 [Photobacterium sp. GB-50]